MVSNVQRIKDLVESYWLPGSLNPDPYRHDTTLPSGLIHFALDAMIDWEKRGFIANMGVYHGHFGGVCEACLGGIAAIYASKVPRKEWAEIECTIDISDRCGADLETLFKLERVLNMARCGEMAGMFAEIGLDWNEGSKFNRDISAFYKNSECRFAFVDDMRQLADDLAFAGY